MSVEKSAVWLLLVALSAGAAGARTKPSKAVATEPQSLLARAEQALAAFEKQHDDAATVAEPALALERAELELAVVEASGPDELRATARRDALEKRVADAKRRLDQAKRPKPGVKPADKTRVSALEGRQERARQRLIVLMADADLASGMGAELIEPEQRAFDPGLASAMEKRSATLKKQLATVKLPEFQGDAARITSNLAEALRAGNHGTGELALQRIAERKLGTGSQSLSAACKRLSKGDLLWRLRLAEAVVQNAISRGYSKNALFATSNIPDTETAATEVLTQRVLEAAADVQAQKSCAGQSVLEGVPSEVSALGEASFTAQLLARQSAREAAQALPRVAGLDQTRDAWQKKLKPAIARVEKSAAAAKAAEKKFQMAVAQTKTGLVTLDPLRTMESEAKAAAWDGQQLLSDLAQLRAAEAGLGRDLTAAAARSAELKASLAVARTDLGKLRTAVTKLGQPSGKDVARDLAINAAKANLARAEASLKDATAAAAAAERDWGKARTLTDLGAAKDLNARQAKLQAQDDALKALIADAKQRGQGADVQRRQMLAKGSPQGCNLGDIDWAEVKYPQKEEFGEGTMGGASVEQVDYGDTDGNGAYEAFVFWHGSRSGTASGDFSELVVFELDRKCRPRQLGYADGGLFARPELRGKTYRIDYSVRGPDEPACCPSRTGFSEFRVVAGKLQQVR